MGSTQFVDSNQSEKLNESAPQINQEFYSIAELAHRWRCSRGTVYNRLRSVGAKVLDFSARGKKGKKAISAAVVYEIEGRHTKRLT